MNISKSTIIRTLVLLLALVNQVLTVAGKNPLPIGDEQATELLSIVFTIVAAVYAWWKNNSFTKQAIAADKYMNDLKKNYK